MGNGEPTSKRGGIAPVMAALADLKDRMTELEVGHRNPEGHEDLLECPTCFAKISHKRYPQHYETHQPKKKEAPHVVTHPFTYGLGRCDTCNKIEARNLPEVISHLPDLLKFVKEKSDAGYECANCHLPITDPAIPKCALCDSTKAIKRPPKH